MVAVGLRYLPERGDIVWLDFGQSKGHEQTGRRPALIVSPKDYNTKTGLAVCCPLTSKSKGYPFEVRVENGVISGVILSDQIKTIDWRARKVKFICRTSQTELSEVLAKISTLIT